MRHCWTVVCRISSIDKDSNNLTLASTLEQIGLPPDVIDEANTQRDSGKNEVAFPFEHHVVSWFVRSDPVQAETGRARVKLIPPEGEPIEGEAVPLRLDENPSYRLRVISKNFPFRGLGQYWYSVETDRNDDDWQEVTRVPIRVQMTEPAG